MGKLPKPGRVEKSYFLLSCHLLAKLVPIFAEKNLIMTEILIENPDYENGRMHFIGTENEDSVLTRSSEIVSEFLNKWNTNVVFISLTCRSESLKALVKNESAVARLYTIDQKNHDPNVILRKARGMVNRRFVRAIVVEGININPLSIHEWIDRFKYWRTTHEVIIGVCDDDLEATSNG